MDTSRSAIVLAGGESRRMGQPKAWLSWGGQPLLSRILDAVAAQVGTRIVVASPHQSLPPLPAGVRLAVDRRPQRGPLEGLRAGLACSDPSTDCCFVCSCDIPLLRPEFVERMFTLLSTEVEIVVPRDEHYVHPLAGVYRRRVLPAIETLLEQDQLSLQALLQRVPTREVPVDQLRDVDPLLQSLQNLNTLQEYRQAVQDFTRQQQQASHNQ